MFRLHSITAFLAALSVVVALAPAASAANCYAVGQRVAAQKGGELMQASEETRGGQTVCRIVIRVPGREGERPRRAELVVPAN